jgi:threonine dehydratase
VTVTGPLPVTTADIREAAAALEGIVVRTPTVRSQTLSAICGADIWVKFENLQFTASFKDRGAANRMRLLTAEERARGVVAMSAGNHAQAVAHHATLLGIPSTIVMPRFTPNVKVHNTQTLGATVVLHGMDLAEAGERAREIERTEGRVFIPPYDDRSVIAGQGTCGLELLEDAPDIDTIVVPVGGGGLLAGMAVVAREVRPDLTIVGVQSELYPSMVAALHHEQPSCGGSTVAEGIAVPRAGILTTAIFEALVDDVVTVDESHLEQAIFLLLEIEKTVVEGAGAAGLAAVLADPDRFAGRKVGIVLTGGNIDPRILSQVIMRGMVRTGRLTRMTVDISDVPGTLATVSACVGDLGGNIVEVSHQRVFSDLSLKSAVLEILVETRDRVHAEQIRAALVDAGFRVETRA